jgi:hypothetical protein
MKTSATKVTPLELTIDLGLIAITTVLAYLWWGELWPSRVTLSAASASCAALSLNASLCGLGTYSLMRTLSYAATVLSMLAAALLVARLLNHKTLPGLLWVAMSILLLIYPAYALTILKIKASDGPALVMQASVVVAFFLLGLLKFDLAHPPGADTE